VRSDRELQRDILSSLDWESAVHAERIGVIVADGTATLQGTVGSFAEKAAAGRVASHVHGVREVVNTLVVTPEERNVKTNGALLTAVENALVSDSLVPLGAIEAAVSDGWVTLTGAVDAQFERSAAQVAVERLDGVKGVNNFIQLRPRATPADVKAQIAAAFKRSAVVDASRVDVDVRDGSVFLTGTVRSLAEREEAERAAWNAPGVRVVDNRLQVSLEHRALDEPAGRMTR
jgi:osmotically-inducible protein OsmY